MSLSRYLARDKSTIDEMIPSREAGTIAGEDFLLLFDESEGVSKKSLVSDVVGSTPVAEFESGVEMIFQQSNIPTGWSLETSPAFNSAMIRVDTTPLSSGGTNPFASTFQDTNTSGNISASPTTFTIGNTSLTEANLPSHNHAAGVRLQANEPLAQRIAATGGITPTPGLVPSSTTVLDVINDNAYRFSWTGDPAGGAGTAHGHPTSPLTHNHTTNYSSAPIGGLDLRYTDAIVCSKD